MNIGDNVTIPVPDVDRSKLDHRNVMALIIEKNNGFYKLANQHGTFKSMFARNQINLCNNVFINPEDVSSKEINLREAVAAESSSGLLQGYFHCNCTQKCNSNRCKCLKLKRLCNSRCHHSNTCDNKSN